VLHQTKQKLTFPKKEAGAQFPKEDSIQHPTVPMATKTMAKSTPLSITLLSCNPVAFVREKVSLSPSNQLLC